MKGLRMVNTVAFTLMIATNALANLIPLGGNTTGQVSNSYANLFTPAPITFSIWGVIYLLLLGFILLQWGLMDKEGHSGEIRERIGYWFALSCLLNIGWIITWHYRAIAYSLLCIILLLFTLIKIENAISERSESVGTRILSYAGFDLYYGWIIAATIANASAVLVGVGWNRWGLTEEFWTTAIILIGAAIGCAVVLTEKRWISGVAVIWAYIGILIRHLPDPNVAHDHTAIVTALMAGITVLVFSIILSVMGVVRGHDYSESVEKLTAK